MENNSNIKFCPECGSSNAVSDVFCSKCGYNFKARADDTVISTTTNKRYSGIIISIIVCIVIVVIGAGAYYYFDSGGKKAETTKVIPTSKIQSTPIIQVTTEPTPKAVTDEVLKIPDYADGDIRAWYILPDADKEIINERELQYLSAPELELARNEIYARHGRQFQTEYIQQYFNNLPWYKINPNYNYDNEDSMLSQIELKNIRIIVAEENRRKEN